MGCDSGGRSKTRRRGDEPEITAFPRKRIEIVTTGIDDALQGRGGSPYKGKNWIGLRVPAHIVDDETRYLFMLASFSISYGQNARIVGFRQGWSLGLKQTLPGDAVRYVEQMVSDPWFKLPDGNISWHLRQMAIDHPKASGLSRGANVIPPIANLAFKQSDTPALLYQSATVASGFYTDLTDYVPPNLGRPWGEALAPNLHTFYDLKTEWRDSHAWSALDIPVTGPAKVQLFASVLQTDPATRTAIDLPVAPDPILEGGLSPEEQFLINFPDAIIWRVAGALAVELEDYHL